MVAVRSCEVPVRTVREWLCDNNNTELLDEIVPLSIVCTRERPGFAGAFLFLRN